jgi:hypothetical protein
VRSDDDGRRARQNVRSFIWNKGFLVSLGFFCMRRLRHGQESIMRKAARMVQNNNPEDLSAMDLKEMLIRIHCTLTLFYA